MDHTGNAWLPESVASAGPLPPDIPKDPMEFLSRSWSSCAIEISKVLAPPAAGAGPGSIPSDAAWELEDEGSVVSGTTFSFASSGTSQLVLERIMSQSQEVSPLTSGRLSYSSGPLNGGQSCGSLSDSPPVSPSNIDDVKSQQLSRVSNTPRAHYREGNKTVGRWLKDKREKKKEETRAHNAQLHAAISVAAVAAAVATIATATAATSSSSKDDRAAKTDSAVASAATLVAAQCVEAAEALGADRDHLTSVVGSAVSVRSSGDIATLTAAAATALRGAATLKARALKEVWNIAAVIPVEKNHHQNKKPTDDGGGDLSGDLAPENFVSLCNQELLARGTELLKRTRNGDLHWKMVSVYIHRTGVVMLKMRSSHVAGAITKKKKSVVTAVCKEVQAWPGRHLLEGGERRRYFGLRTADRRVIEFECRSEREYELFTQGVPRLLDMVAKTTVG